MMKNKKEINSNYNDERICFMICHSKSFEMIEKDKELKSAFADFIFNKSQLTWQGFKNIDHRKSGFEKCGQNMVKNIPNEILSRIEPQTTLWATRLNQKYRIIFARIDCTMVIYYISDHYGDH